LEPYNLNDGGVGKLIISNDQRAALKEWAVAVQALEAGRQIVILRKGGIVEETRHFELRNLGFYLYPTFEHQKKHLLKPSEQEQIEATTANWHPDIETISIRCYAEAMDDIEVFSQEQLDRIRDKHIWTDEFAAERLKWKRTQPLHVILLRVYKLAQPLELRIRPEYNGCKSWHDLELTAAIAKIEAFPVLTDEQFEAERTSIKQTLDTAISSEN
jgi:hypothetical protein